MTKRKPSGIELDYTKDSLFDALGLQRLRDSYMLEDERSPQERYKYVAELFGSDDEHAIRLYKYFSDHWWSNSTPILSMGRSKRSLPISCFLNYVEDTAEGLVENLNETNWLSMYGGGVGIHMRTRSADDKSVGVMPHLKTYDASTLAYRQGRTRRGSYAPYLDIDHPDIMNFIELRKPTGDPNIRCMNLHHGINISDKFMELIELCMVDPKADPTWHLIDPHTGETVDTVDARALWERILVTRTHTGEPYMHFIDTANRAMPDFLKDLGLKIHGSNICIEIELPTNKDRTAVCCLGSVNLDYWDEYKDNYQFFKDVLEMLDNVLTYFIANAPDTIKRAKFSAMRERSVGVGVMGFHSFLQAKGVPFESVTAKSFNTHIFKALKENLDKANLELGTERGECPDAKGTGRRFSHTRAVAPTASSSIIMGNTSPSIEPFRANAYRQDTLSGSHLNKNKHLDAIIKTLSKDEKEYDKIWSSIISNDGSCQHLTVLSDEQKEVFKTAMEIDQRWIIELAGDRAGLIDQGQSINIFFRPNTHIKYLHAVHFMAWKRGIKGLYYLRSDKIRKADKLGVQVERQIIEEIDLTAIINDDDCLACQ